jgi:AcrR family transcriptional regulator
MYRSAPAYSGQVPKLWSETIESHRREVADAVIDTTAALVAEHGLRSVTMAQIAEGAGIGRATLYKYFPDVEAILVTWHERHVTRHLDRLVELRDSAGDAGDGLEAVLEGYALLCHDGPHRRYGTDLVALVHGADHVRPARQRLTHFLRDLLGQAAAAGRVRGDIGPDELAAYCLHALGASADLPSKAAVRRLVTVTLAGLRPDAPRV